MSNRRREAAKVMKALPEKIVSTMVYFQEFKVECTCGICQYKNWMYSESYRLGHISEIPKKKTRKEPGFKFSLN